MTWIGTLQEFASNVSAWWLRGKNLGTFLEANAATQDNAVSAMAQGLYLSQPLRCDASALPVLARDRGITLYPTEPDASRRYRLSRWRQLRRQFGTCQGMMRNLQPFFMGTVSPSGTLPKIQMVHQDGGGTSATWHALSPSGEYTWSRKTASNWNWDGQTAKWSRLWCIVDVSTLGLPAQPLWDGAQTWDGGSIWDGLYTSDQIGDMVSALIESKPRPSILHGLIFATDPASFDPTAASAAVGDGSTTLPAGNWDFVIDKNTGKPTRLASAVYAYDLSPT